MTQGGNYVTILGGPWSDPGWGQPSKDAVIQALEQRLREVCSKPHAYAWVTDVVDGKLEIVTAPGQVVLVTNPTGLDIKPGQSVRINGETGQIVDRADPSRAFGMIATVRRVVDEKMCEVEAMPDARMIRYVCDRPKKGDRVLLDPSNQIGVKNLGPAPTPLVFDGEVDVDWEDVGGLAEAKRSLREAVEEPVTKAKVYERYGKKPARGILLYGPPGNGKTMLAKAAATAFAKMHGAKAGGGFVYVRGPELLQKWVGSSEENIRQIFKSARMYAEREGRPALVFLDECDAVLAKRGRSHMEGMERTTVPQFLSEMDGLEDSGAMIILASNRPDTIDPAVVRDGRVDRKIFVGRPTREDAADILRRALASRPLAAKADELAQGAVERAYSPGNVLATIHLRDKREERLTLAHVMSGAMLVGLVEQATQLAIRRELDGGKPKGIAPEDLRAAVERALEENLSIDHGEAVGDVVDVSQVAGITPANRAVARAETGRVWLPGRH